MTQTHRECWAAGFSECSGPMSREHVVSNAVFDEAMLEVQGIHAFGGLTKVVSTASLTARVLCQRHNSLLSPLDEEAGRLSDAIKTARVGSEHVQHKVNGALLERWALKVLVNLLASRWTEKGFFPPGPDIVAKVFGSMPLQGQSGLYLLENYQGSAPPDSFFYCVLVSQHETHPQVLGLVASLSGVPFVLSVCRQPLDEILRDHSPFGPFETSNARTAYHPRRVAFGDRASGDLSLTLEFDWGQGDRPAEPATGDE